MFAITHIVIQVNKLMLYPSQILSKQDIEKHSFNKDFL